LKPVSKRGHGENIRQLKVDLAWLRLPILEHGMVKFVHAGLHETHIVELDKATTSALGRVVLLVEAADIGGMVSCKVLLEGLLGRGIW
jgi:hypothetical protein